MGNRAGNGAGVVVLVVVATGCAAAPPTTLNHTPHVLGLECTITVADDTALFDLGLRSEKEHTMLLLGEGDHLAARRGDGPLYLLAPYVAGDSTGGYVDKKYEATIVGNGDPRIAWSRGDEPYAWVTVPTPPALALRFEREPAETLSWASLSEDGPDIETELWVTCETASQIGACAQAYGERVAPYCGLRRTFPKSVSSAPVAELVTPTPTEGDLSRCDALVVLATRTRQVDVSAAGLAPGATCASRRTSTLKFTRGPR